MTTAILEPECPSIDPAAFVDPAWPQSWSRQLVALLVAGHYREAYDVLAEKVPYVDNQVRPYAERLAGKDNHWTHTHAWLARAIDVATPLKILDVGCSIGSHAIEFAREGHQTWGVDVLPQMIARGCELVESLGLSSRVHLQEGDIRCLDQYFEPAMFDAAVACDIFEHLDDDALMQVLAGLRRVVRAGGTISIQTSPGLYYYWFEPDRRKLLPLLIPMAWLPDAAFTAYVRWLDRSYVRGVRREPTTFYRHEHGHVNCMDHVHLRGLLEKAGLADVRTFAVHAHPGFKDEGCFRTPWLRRLFGRKSIAARNVFGVARVPATSAERTPSSRCASSCQKAGGRSTNCPTEKPG
jgi:ubiquinone/menaquinone biosynthesis C-methylase UbiE